MDTVGTRIMIVDDEEIVRVSLGNWLKEDGHEVMLAASGLEALQMLEDRICDIMLLDLKMPRMSGLEVLAKVKTSKPGIQVLMMTAYASVETAVDAMQKGAYDYLVKPFEPEELKILIKRVMEKQALQQENVALKQRIEDAFGTDEIVGECPAMKTIFQLVRDVAASNSTVLITGESGTGKELIAKAIHANSDRKYMPFVPVSLGALPETLVESELFGHQKGAFTGATYARRGRFELADGGTLFLDEIGDLSPKAQVDLLRVLQESKFTRIGGTREVSVDVRIVAATNRDLRQMVKEGQFREDLFYRFNVVSIELPPLRERGDDIVLLAQRFLREFASKTNKPIKGFSNEALAIIRGYDWPGNVRELENAVERAFVVVKGEVIKSNHLPFNIRSREEQADSRSLKAVEKHHIRRVLAETGWNISQAAKALEIDRVTLYNKIKKYDIQEET
ncbi:MAG: sigma-54-dependent Fis family transcriptional regulator [Candidatus Eisenbacteria sp.]|nr:sigma-54-dependent Fis family transcriptional regulator [Candidatus Eisenbacteria bacterium]